MSVQTTVLENGRWVTRNVDLYHVRAQNTETPRKEQTQPSISFPKQPSLGVLTKTLVRSSVINRIIPASIRHKTKNDVLFISANSITIKEAKGDYTLGEIATKNDFDSTIKSARIIGERRHLTKHDDSYNVLKEEMHWQDIYNTEDSDFMDEEDCHDRAAAFGRRQLPPHILVLALESNRLVFLCAVSGKSEHPELFCSQKVLPAPTSPLQGLGELIAVDPQSRAMAVAAHEGRAYVYVLKSMNEMRAEFTGTSRLEPIKEERLILLDGTILKMEFLHPPEKEANRIILLLVVAWGHQSHLICYDWNADLPLHQSQLRPNKMLLHPDERLPLLLIPLLKNSAFILVCENRMVLIKDILTGTFQRYFHCLAAEQEPQQPGVSNRRPIWVQWARPMRSKKLRPNEDNIVLCREDGIVQYIVVDHGIKQMIDSNHNVGRLGVNMNTSFATVDLGLYTEDLLVAGGDESDGGLWAFPPRQEFPNQRGVIPNWTPINDFAVASGPIDRQTAGISASANNASKGQQRLFACTGRGNHGAISEIRYGVEASKKIATADIGVELKNGVLGIWALHGFYGTVGEQNTHLKDVTYVIMSYPQRTHLLRLWLHQDLERIRDHVGLLEPVIHLIGDDIGLELNARTIAVGRTDQGLTIQITEKSLRATSLPLPSDEELKEEDAEDKKPNKSQLDAEIPQPRYTYPFEDSRILAAYIHTAVDETVIVLAIQRDEEIYLEFGSFATEYQPLDQRIPLHAQPSCLSLLEVENETLILVGTLAGELEIYLLGDIGLGLRISGTTIRHAFSGPFGICDSIATIARATKEGVQLLLVCGLRDGTIEILKLSSGKDKYHLSLHEKLAFGHTSVTVYKGMMTNRVIIHCDNTLCILEYPQKDSKAPATILDVWITDPNAPSLQQGQVSAISQVVDSWLPGKTPGFTAESFVCVDRDSLHTVSLDPQPKMVPRRLELGGSPVRVLHSVRLEKLIVLHNKFEILRTARRINGQPNVSGKRALRPTISLLDLKTSDAEEPSEKPSEKPYDSQVRMILECKPGEKCLGITEWFPKVGKHEYHMLIINTTLTRARKPVGRLLLFAITKEEDHQPPRILTKKRIDTDEPVYSVAVYPNKSLVYCCGNDLCMQSLGVAEPPRLHLLPPVKLAMRSPARHITVKEPYIYVSSSRESLSVYRYSDGQLIYQFGDQSARYGLHHLQLPSQSLVLASDMSHTVVGLWQPPERRIDNAMTTVFEAVLPRSMTRLRRISRPAWSRADRHVHARTLATLSHAPILGDETILGSSADGTLTQLSILSGPEWRLLRFIQNMAERHALICPFHPGNPHKRPIEPSDARPHYMHIDGDILERIVDRGAEGVLDEMLDVEPDRDSYTDFGSREERRERFEELAKGVLMDVEGGEALGRVMLWLEYLLRRVL